ncbi:MAG: hypothetical protein ACREIV_01755, partial [Planctomycetaceae bacterium]
LVVCRGENLYTSGLVLISPLELDVREDAVSGQVRVTVKNAVTDSYQHDVHVKAIGSANDQFVSGETDLRGIFTADGLRGTSTVIARAGDDHYAFHRGEAMLGQVQESAPAELPSPDASAEQRDGASAGKDALLEQLRQQNSIFNDFQRQNYRNLLENEERGVKAKDAY